MTELLFQGNVMKSEPVNHELDFLAHNLRLSRTVIAQLEPGDGTRYELLITPLELFNDIFYFGEGIAEQALVVIRVEGGTPIGACVYHPEYQEQLELICRNNAWTWRLMEWWLNLLIEKVYG